MRQFLLLFGAFFALLLNANTVAAVGEPTMYIGLDYLLMDFEDDANNNADLDAAAVRFGTSLNENLALEGRLGVGVSDDTVAGVDYELGNFVGVYARGIIPYQNLELYGVVGVSRVDLSISGPANPSDGDSSGLSYGLGVNFRVGERLGLGLEYLMLLDNSDYELTTINIGLKSYF